ncbi:hypothetical protein TOPH_03328 [Tolypocladium ophioglossoides CBS 100239]|uniref:Uncharacterized protein n=1 Tax=Tolypocladium ophioglossoides (strain CBS 100239) TaxID=1163406 RepID=A0A0L0NDN0_TOLOC|nr:hypothetical protein TOPH_03328 [Tolypocladium ophioglossoides CBS 100239]
MSRRVKGRIGSRTRYSQFVRPASLRSSITTNPCRHASERQVTRRTYQEEKPRSSLDRLPSTTNRVRLRRTHQISILLEVLMLSRSIHLPQFPRVDRANFNYRHLRNKSQCQPRILSDKLDIIEFAQAQTVNPIELNAPQLPPIPPTDRESSQGYQAMAASLNKNLRHSATEVDIDAAPQGAARRHQGSSHHTPVMHRRSTVTPGGTTITTPSFTRIDIPYNNSTTAAIKPSFP